MNLKNIKISIQLRVGFAILLLFAILLGAVGFIQSNRIHLQTETMYQHPLKVRRTIELISSNVLNMRMNIRDFLLVEDATARPPMCPGDRPTDGSQTGHLQSHPAPEDRRPHGRGLPCQRRIFRSRDRAFLQDPGRFPRRTHPPFRGCGTSAEDATRDAFSESRGPSPQGSIRAPGALCSHGRGYGLRRSASSPIPLLLSPQSRAPVSAFFRTLR